MLFSRVSAFETGIGVQQTVAREPFSCDMRVGIILLAQDLAANCEPLNSSAHSKPASEQAFKYFSRT